MTGNKRHTQTKYLAIKDYLEYKKIEEENWFFSDEMNKFLKDHGLPMTDELSKYNLRVFMDNAVQIHIYNMNEIKDADINIH
jgi:hypothetical protein